MPKRDSDWILPEVQTLTDSNPSISPMPRRRERPIVRFLQEVYPILFSIALFGLYVVFTFLKLLITVVMGLLHWRRLVGQHIVKNRPKKRVVIVGGGYAGLFAALDLEHDFDCTVVEPKDFYEFTPSRLRSIVEPAHTTRIQVELQSILSRSTVVHDKVVKVQSNSVMVERDIDPIAFDYLIITSGSRYPDPRFPRSDGTPHVSTRVESLHERSSKNAKYGYTMREQQSHFGDEVAPDADVAETTRQGDDIVLSARAVYFGDFHKQIRQAPSILVIGGGTVGVEMASEIRERFPNKHVTIVNSPDHLLKNMPGYAISYAEHWCRQNNVEMVLGDRIVSQDGRVFKTRKGKSIRADLAFLCTGNVPNAEFLSNGGLPDAERLISKTSGLVRVNEHLQLQGHDNIFVAGDLTDIPHSQEKLCQSAAAEIKVVLANIRRLELRSPMKRYRPTDFPMLISLGKYDALLVYKHFSFGGFIPAVMKEFVEWKEMVWYWNWSYFKPTHFRQTALLDMKAPICHPHIV